MSISTFLSDKPSAIFFDIDDTLSRDGVIAEHNKDTLIALANMDIKVVIATGRPKPLLPPDIIALYDNGVLDAIICKNGQYSFHKNSSKETVISHYPMTTEQIQHAIDICEQQKFIYKLDTKKNIAWARDNYINIPVVIENTCFIIDPNIYKSDEVYQCSIFFEKDAEFAVGNDHGNSINEQIQHINFAKLGLKLVPWHAIGADILPIDASKARAIKDVCHYFNISPDNCMAFGDGHNDIEMFELVGYPVAMGDAVDSLKKTAVANNGIITGTIEENGIQTALAHYGVL